MLVLVLNAGSSSQKSCLYDLEKSIPDTPPQPIWEADIDWSSEQEGILTVESNDRESEIKLENRDTALEILLNTLVEGDTKVIDSLDEIEVVGHRVVHGGAKYSQPIIIDDDVKKGDRRSNSPRTQSQPR